ncbi:hypothetical protein CEP51_008326 [Fusarium floridanum]|uniref:Heterokaryon incompatibility domain-containing protein n=1 Tax=Fusarium floridanum TaxID=1325733 RepID=A0A428RLA3_9HYPO|nr:hypothetical protein CEP51_008326 [Fusarium floridanum]
MGRLVTGATSSDDHMRALRQWLEDCPTNHPECCLTLSGSQVLQVESASLPTRCIEVTRGSDGARRVRIVETGQKRGKYITLSHRWTSSTAEISTTRRNYAERLTGGNFERLPRIFENTFDLAEMLGVPLVWIDSICIIQDSVEDWKNEAGKMAEYYQSSLFTVTGFETTTELGLFTAPERDIPKLARLPYRDRDGTVKGSFYIARAKDHEAKTQYTRLVGQSELLTRGWIFQEWLLSRRIVSFTRAGCFYQCQRLKPRNPTGGEVSVSEGEEGSANLVFKSKLRLDNLSIPSLIFSQWRLTAHLYSGLALTKAGEDRLIALSGVAKEFSKALGRVGVADTSTDGQYLSGLWRGDLWMGLLWEVNGVNIHPRLPSIPTWSWASVMHPVIFTVTSNSQSEPLVRLLGIKQTSAEEQKRVIDNLAGSGASEDSQVSYFLGTKFNTLILSGKLLRLRVGGGFGPGPDLRLAANRSGHKIDREHIKGEDERPRRDYSERARANWRRVSVTVAPEELCGWASIEDPTANSTTVPMDVMALPISTTFVKGYYGFGLGYLKPSHKVYIVLFLQRVAEGSACFQRIGTGRVFGHTVETELQLAQEVKFWLV